MGEMRITNIQDTLVKQDLVQRLQETLLSQARTGQSEIDPQGMERTRAAQETITQGRETSETSVRDEDQGRRKEPFLSRKHPHRREDPSPPPHENEDEGTIIDLKA